MTQAVDSFSPHTATSASALNARGIPFALRYHYNTTRTERDLLAVAGVGFSLIAEFDTQTYHPPLHAPHLGPAHAQTAVAVARKLGLPDDCVIWFTADTYIGQADYGKAQQYWSGAQAVCHDAGYRCGAYGGSKLIDWLSAAGAADLTWQCGAASWNEYVDSRTACLKQLWGQPVIGGVQVDLNDILKPDCGAWMPHPTQLEDDMPYTPDDLAAIIGPVVRTELEKNNANVNQTEPYSNLQLHGDMLGLLAILGQIGDVSNPAAVTAIIDAIRALPSAVVDEIKGRL